MNSHQRLITKARRTRSDTKHRMHIVLFAAFATSWLAGFRVSYAAEDARSIVAEAQRRTDSESQRYEGLLQVFDAKGKISDKRWTYDRRGAHGQSKSVLRFVSPPEVKGVALLVVNHPDRA